MSVFYGYFLAGVDFRHSLELAHALPSPSSVSAPVSAQSAPAGRGAAPPPEEGAEGAGPADLLLDHGNIAVRP